MNYIKEGDVILTLSIYLYALDPDRGEMRSSDKDIRELELGQNKANR
jgi:hypothetical protein